MVEVGCTEAHVSHTQQGPFQGPVWVVGDSGLGVGHFGKPHVAGVDDHACPSPQALEVFEDRQLGGQPELDDVYHVCRTHAMPHMRAGCRNDRLQTE